MEKEGAILIADIKDIEAMGAFEIISKIPKILSILKKTIRFIHENDIDIFIPIDNPGFNFRVIKKLSKIRTKVFYFIPPQIWAWRKKRAEFLKKYVNKLGVIFPFEVDFYKDYGINAIYCGHPLAENYPENIPLDEAVFKQRYKGIADGSECFNLGLMPGSRDSEIKSLLPVLIKTHIKLKERFHNLKSHIPVSPNSSFDIINSYIPDDISDEIILYDNVDDVFDICDFAIIASGTATLQASLYPIPFFIIYKMHSLSYILAKHFVLLKNIGISNIILNEEIAPEFIQGNADPDILSKRLMEYIDNYEIIYKMMEKFNILKKMLIKKDSMKNMTREIYNMFSISRKKDWEQ